MKRTNLIRSTLGYLNSPNKVELLSAVFSDAFGPSNRKQKYSLEEHIMATYHWICAAQDANPGGGVSGWYSLKDGWGDPYPETTGYIITSMLALGNFKNIQDCIKRAIAMADWEIDVQLNSGAVRGGTLRTDPSPAVFNTGQVVFGWVRAYQETADEKYIYAAKCAAEWLLNVQDYDGAWRRFLSPLTTSLVCTFNSRTAWSLVLLGQVIGEEKYIDSGQKNLEWCLTQQQPDGWFRNNSFSPNEIPLLHTIGYVIEGLLEAGILLQSSRFIDSATLALESLLEHLGKDGHLWGRYDSGWKSTTRWRCLTGEAQIALSLLKLYELTREEKYFNGGKLINEQLMNFQVLNSGKAEVIGGVKGSHPIWGRMNVFRILIGLQSSFWIAYLSNRV